MRIPKEMDPHRELYDYDLSSHIITILDWGEETGNQKFVAHHHSDGDNKPSSILVNGLGKFGTFNFSNETQEFPIARFTVEQVRTLILAYSYIRVSQHFYTAARQICLCRYNNYKIC